MRSVLVTHERRVRRHLHSACFRVPMISAGTTEDKTEVDNRVAYSGVGLNLKTSRPKVAQIRSAVRALLSVPPSAARAMAIRDELAAHNAASEAAVLLEQLAATHKPVAGSTVAPPAPA